MIPNQLVGTAVNGLSILRAWREYLTLTQTKVTVWLSIYQRHKDERNPIGCCRTQ